MIAPYPLLWPVDRQRTRTPEPTKSAVTLASARDHLLKQMDLLGAKITVLSSNAVLRKDGLPLAKQPKVSDVGVALWFKWSVVGEWICVSCDQYDSISGNIRAIGLSIAEIRSFTGRLAIPVRTIIGNLFNCKPPEEQKPSSSGSQSPPPKNQPWPDGDWRHVLQFTSKIITWTEANTNYRRLAKLYHPDKVGGDTAKFQELNNAFEQAKKHFGFKSK